jgi:hypothetical protein
MLATHYKGGEYELLHNARLESSRETHVVYRCLVTGTIWVRPADEFYGKVLHEGKYLKRFTLYSPPVQSIAKTCLTNRITAL